MSDFESVLEDDLDMRAEFAVHPRVGEAVRGSTQLKAVARLRAVTVIDRMETSRRRFWWFMNVRRGIYVASAVVLTAIAASSGFAIVFAIPAVYLAYRAWQVWQRTRSVGEQMPGAVRAEGDLLFAGVSNILGTLDPPELVEDVRVADGAATDGRVSWFAEACLIVAMSVLQDAPKALRESHETEHQHARASMEALLGALREQRLPGQAPGTLARELSAVRRDRRRTARAHRRLQQAKLSAPRRQQQAAARERREAYLRERRGARTAKKTRT